MNKVKGKEKEKRYPKGNYEEISKVLENLGYKILKISSRYDFTRLTGDFIAIQITGNDDDELF